MSAPTETDILDAVPEPGGLNPNDILTTERSLESHKIDASPGREFLLRSALEGVSTTYDLVLIDCLLSLATTGRYLAVEPDQQRASLHLLRAGPTRGNPRYFQ